MKKLTCLVIDDEPLARALVLEYLSDFPEIEVAQECGDGFEAAKAIALHHPDLIFLDVQMPKISGFELLELLDVQPFVIFTTAFDQYAMKAFELHAVDYLLKPFNKERFHAAIQKFMTFYTAGTSQQAFANLLAEPIEKQEQSSRIVVKKGSEILIFPVHEVNRFEAYDDYVKIFIGSNVYLKKQTLATLEKLLDPNEFVRVHRSHLVRVSQVTKLEQNGDALLRSGEKIPVSKSGYARLKVLLGL